VTSPLDDIRVCDVTQNLAGPFCAQILADLGATVIKVEPPGGDLGRLWGPPFWGEDSTLFLSANRGKRSIILDLKQKEGMDVLKRIGASSDVFIQSSRPAAALGLGIDEASVRVWNEDIVHMSLSAYGQRGPMSDQPGYDPLMQAYAGIISVTGQPEGPPTRVGGSVVDFGTGMWAALSIISALRERDRTGKGVALETSLMDTSLAWVSYHMMGYMATGEVPGPRGSSLGAIAPYRAFPTLDGYVMIAAGNDAIFRRLCDALGLVGTADDPRFGSNSDRVAHRNDLDAIIEGATSQISTDELLERTLRSAIPASAIKSIADVVDDPQVAEAGMFQTLGHPELEGYRDVSLPLQIDGVRPRAARVPPKPGEHSIEILEELGFDGEEVDYLFDVGAVSKGS
jgi:crotonobetainyl-CoA:carnitine CoA-transferase CaiB-like acyl-CoA transferase